MIFGCCTTIDNYKLLQSTGYDSISLSAADVMEMSEEQLAQAVAIVKAGPLKCDDMNIFCRGDLKLAGPGFDPAKVEAYSQELMRRAAQLGVTKIGIGSPGARNLPDGYDRKKGNAELAQSAKIAAAAGAPHGIKIMLEAICGQECNHITTTEELLAFMDEQGLKDSMRIVYDIYHADRMDESLDWIDKAFPWIDLVHIAEYRASDGTRPYLVEESKDNYKRYLDRFAQLGYKGCVAIESFEGDINVEASKSLAILKSIV